MSNLKPRVTKEVITRFYVEIGDWIQAGPFDTREEAEIALKECLSPVGIRSSKPKDGPRDDVDPYVIAAAFRASSKRP